MTGRSRKRKRSQEGTTTRPSPRITDRIPSLLSTQQSRSASAKDAHLEIVLQKWDPLCVNCRTGFDTLFLGICELSRPIESRSWFTPHLTYDEMLSSQATCSFCAHLIETFGSRGGLSMSPRLYWSLANASGLWEDRLPGLRLDPNTTVVASVYHYDSPHVVNFMPNV
jgi:hypothetical protein